MISRAILLDTNVLSEMMRATPASAVAAWYLAQDAASLYTTAITLAEIAFDVGILPDGKRRDALTHLCGVIFDEGLRGRVLPFDALAAQHYAWVRAGRQRRGLPMAVLDAQIAAIALTVGASVATRNTAEFEGCGVALINPWHL